MPFPVYRPRRLRESPLLRKMVRETTLAVDDLVMPYFVVQRRPGAPLGVEPTYCCPRGITRMLDFRSMANSRVRPKMIEPSLGRSVKPVQAAAIEVRQMAGISVAIISSLRSIGWAS